jgi:uncharacterized protein YigE (DUF2233 family)
MRQTRLGVLCQKLAIFALLGACTTGASSATSPSASEPSTKPSAKSSSKGPFALPAAATSSEFLDVRVDRKAHRVTMHLDDPNGQKYSSVDALRRHLDGGGAPALLVTNGGMYQKNQHPLGLFIEAGVTKQPLVTRTGRPSDGNFYLQPNGVFAITHLGPAVVRTSNWAMFQSKAKVSFATQSGPMTIIDSQINEAFNPDSDSRYLRNAVCVSNKRELWFTISRDPVTFFELATHQKALGCTQALYLDGAISSAYTPDETVNGWSGGLGPLIAVTAP